MRAYIVACLLHSVLDSAFALFCFRAERGLTSPVKARVRRTRLHFDLLVQEVFTDTYLCFL